MINRMLAAAAAGVAAGMLLGLTSVATAQTASQILGYDALMARLGVGNFPTGANVVVAQVEAPESPGNYGPNQANGEFVGKTFTAMSGAPGLPPSAYPRLLGRRAARDIAADAPITAAMVEDGAELA